MTNINEIANEVFSMFIENSEQTFTDVEYFNNLSAKYPSLRKDSKNESF